MEQVEMRVLDLMTEEVVTLDRNDELALADDLMNLGRIRHIPVLDDDALAGIITQRDLFRSALLQSLGDGTIAQDRALTWIRIKSVMSTDVVTVSPTTPVRVAAKLMIQQKVGCLPVLEQGKLVGILTEADFVAAFADHKGA
jgi:CBS domain-containing protein